MSRTFTNDAVYVGRINYNFNEIGNSLEKLWKTFFLNRQRKKKTRIFFYQHIGNKTSTILKPA
jgi:hypothetical protein